MKFKQTCKRCTGNVRIPHDSGLCGACREDTHKVKVRCPSCKAVRSLGYRHAARVIAEGSRCGSCAAGGWVKPVNGRPGRKRKSPAAPTSNRIELNGCILVRAAKGRCRDFYFCRNGSHCALYGVPNERDCCKVVGRLSWSGWRCAVENPDIVPDWEDRALMRQERPSNAGLLLDC